MTTLFTPDLAASLNGITRKSIISLAEEDEIKVTEKKINLNEILEADELFFTGTAAEVVPIKKVDQKQLLMEKRKNYNNPSKKIF